MNCAIMQPTYLPWLGFFDLIDQVDKFVLLDDVKVEKCSWHVRNRIKTQQGELFLTIPVSVPKGRLDTLLNEAIINNSADWRRKHLRSIFFAYKKTAFFEEVYDFIRALINFETDILAQFNINIIREICRKLGIATKLFISSEMVGVMGVKDKRVASICRSAGCDRYISPQGSAVYLERETPGGEVVNSMIQLYYHNYEHPVYAQQHGEFVPYMAIIDLLFNHGFAESVEIVRSGRRESIEYLVFREKPTKTAGR